MDQKTLQARLFTVEECNKIIELHKKYTEFIITPTRTLLPDSRNVYYTNTNNSWIKSYNVWDIPVNENTGWMYNRLYDWFTKETSIKLTRKIDAHKLHQYKKGDKFSIHQDKLGAPDRIWNVGIQLNSNYQGGDYILYTDSDPIYVSKQTGTVIAYASDVPHEITTIVNGERWSLVIKIHDWEVVLKTNKTLF